MGARDLLAELAGAGIQIDMDGDRLLVGPAFKLTDDLRGRLREAKAELLALLAPEPEPAANGEVSGRVSARPYALTKAQRDAAHAQPWGDADCSRFLARAAAIRRRGFGVVDAEDLAELAHLLDVQDDGRAICLGCTHLAGTTATGWRCGNHRMAGMPRELAAGLVTTAQRCPGAQAWA